MNRKILTFILTSIWLLFWASPSIALVTKYQEAVDAYNREDYKAAYKLILPLAKKAVAQAQYNLGVMYEKGKGVKKNLKEAKKWFQFAAEQGIIKAQYKLGLIYGKGKGRGGQKTPHKPYLPPRPPQTLPVFCCRMCVNQAIYPTTL